MLDEIHYVDLKPQILKNERVKLERFLKQHDLAYEDDIEFSIAAMNDQDEIIACGCCTKNILKCFAVNSDLRGINIIGQITTRLVANRFENHCKHLFIFTKPDNEKIFQSCGFYLLGKTKEIVLLENIKSGIERYVKSIKVEATGKIGSIVMNCNPFTKGHAFLIEYASKKCDLLYIFVVEENESIFPFDVRFKLVKNGIAHLSNVVVVPSGPYIISRLTFPTYFLKDKIDPQKAQSELDAELFSTKIARNLGITIRFVGEEPNCQVTRAYNQTLQKILPLHGIELEVIERRLNQRGIVISASTVRSRIKEDGIGDWLEEYLPAVTCDYLRSNEAKSVIKGILEN
ncbi:[citrate (pro-3S)-lyase] ligase [Geosporobacter ferrireducens]|uniref:[citrate (pro-3S)-lyase] ligase n=1 Tax=Geosporobacter ferrireducens TaxID=1424294 RepID=UPI002352C7E5|nr:[citrate (pro-3S)-lyase] ligase [Geosporobacter ferrireducens]